MEAATRDDFEEWRDRFTEGRKPRSLNRQVRAVVAGLNRAHELGHVGNREAWRLRPLADDVEDEGDMAIFLTAEQRKALLESASQPAAEFLRGLELTGARPKELLQIHGVDPLTVASQTGTSLAVIEKSYLRFIPSAMGEKLAAVRK